MERVERIVLGRISLKERAAVVSSTAYSEIPYGFKENRVMGRMDLESISSSGILSATELIFKEGIRKQLLNRLEIEAFVRSLPKGNAHTGIEDHLAFPYRQEHLELYHFVVALWKNHQWHLDIWNHKIAFKEGRAIVFIKKQRM